ncbi:MULTISPECIES: pilus assembly PilX family protein [unclassified Halomonas]|uniref:pilus assembly PilX family protein n=1 Tax=unclassified Halomonas TaxID=2609666 RepID=UPI0040334722
MRQQRGAALVIVMALLSAALMLGMSGMQGALIDERLAGNYRAVVQATMNAESAYSKALEAAFIQDMDALDWGAKTYSRSAIEEMAWDDIAHLGQVNDQCATETAVCFYLPLIVDGRKSLVAFGALYANQEGPVVVSHPYFLFLE